MNSKGTRDIWAPGGSDGKTSACNMGDLGLIPASGRYAGEGNGYLLQYSCQAPLSIGFSRQQQSHRALLQGIFQSQGSNLHLLRLLHCRRILTAKTPGKPPIQLRAALFLTLPALLGFWFLPFHAACRVLVSQPSIVPLAVKAGSPNHRTARESLMVLKIILPNVESWLCFSQLKGEKKKKNKKPNLTNSIKDTQIFSESFRRFGIQGGFLIYKSKSNIYSQALICCIASPVTENSYTANWNQYQNGDQLM